jgi:hypothetical protein
MQFRWEDTKESGRLADIHLYEKVILQEIMGRNNSIFSIDTVRTA